MDKGDEAGRLSLQLNPFRENRRRRRSMDSGGVEIPSKRICREAASLPSSRPEENNALFREIDFFSMEKILIPPEVPAVDFFIDPDVNTDLRLCTTGISKQSMEDDGKSCFEEAFHKQGRLAISGLMLRTPRGAGGSPPLSGEDEDRLEMLEISGGGTPIMPPPSENSKKLAPFDGCSCGGVGTREVAEPAQEHSTVEEVRIAFRDRSEASLIPDGWRWRKYGQKGKPPRSYYRCSMTSTCLVRKQVQRCAQDKSILITTYIEWNHDHPLPPSAMPTASIISEAASTFLSGSINPISGGLVNINVISPMIPHCRPIMATISFSAHCPTVTLDLTKSPDPTHPPPQFQAHAQPLQPQVFSRPLYELLHNVSGAVANVPRGVGPHNLADVVSVATEAILTHPKFKNAMVAELLSIIGGAQPEGGGT